jgi:peptidoglycan/xylan/chitin deacetylase (PgdA/CDA1 family)
VKPPTIVTTSWDDGDPLDLTVADLLRERHLAGTFYFPFMGYEGRRTVEPGQLRSLASEGFEVGGHGMSHRVLTPLRSEEVGREVGVCKNRLEDILGEPVRMFCYPKGRLNANVKLQVKRAGYAGARTTRMLSQRLDFDPFRMPTSLLAYPCSRKMYVNSLLRGMSIRGLLDRVTDLIWPGNWVSMAKVLFDQVLGRGGVWHLYGHSWQIEQMGLWDDLKEILDYVAGRKGVVYATNAQVLSFLPERAAATTPRLNAPALK